MKKLSLNRSFEFSQKALMQLGLLNLIFLLQMSLLRLFTFFLYSGLDEYTSRQKVDLLRAFALGIRFDLSVLSYLFVLPFIGIVIGLSLPWVRRYYYMMWPVVAIILACDSGYYSYFQDHLNILIFAFIEDDTTALLWTFWKNYPIIKFAILLILYIIFSVWLIRYFLSEKKIILKSNRPISKWLIALVLICEIILISVSARGSLGLFPLGVADTVISDKSFINYISFNGVHAIHRAVKLKSMQGTKWDENIKRFGYSDPRQAFADYFSIPMEKVPENPLDLLKITTAKNPWAEKTKPHLVVILMESMGGFYLRFHDPQQFNLLGRLEKHFSARPPMLNFFPSHNSTIGSLSSLMVAAPQRPEAAFLTEGEYLQVPFRSSPAHILKKHGYQTRFIYGGNPGWRDVHKFARFQGFASIEGDIDIERKLNKKLQRHDWGIFDEDVFDYVLKTLQEASTPQFVMVLSTTNHPPYQIPQGYRVEPFQIPENLKKRLTTDDKLVEQRLKAYAYSNDQLGQFLNQLDSSPMAAKTVAAITGDHSFWVVDFSAQEEVQKYSVPFYIHTPKEMKINWNPNTFGSHKDIFATLFPLILSNATYESVGENLLDTNQPHYAMHANLLIASPEGIWQVRKDEENPVTRKYKALMAMMDYYFYHEKKKK